MQINYSNLLEKSAEYLPQSFPEGLVTVDDISNFFSNTLFIDRVVSLIHPLTNEKIDDQMTLYSILIPSPWGNRYHLHSISSLWDQGFSFILHNSLINNKVKEIAKDIEKSSSVCCDAHVYCGKKTSASFPPHADSNDNLIVQCEGKTLWRVWDHISTDPRFFRDLKDDPMLEFVMSPGDAVLIPKGQIHQAIPQTDRISVSFPYTPGLQGIQDDITLSWSTDL